MTLRVISEREIARALTRGGRIDGSSLVLKRDRPRVLFSDDVWGVHRPPYLLAAYQFEPPGERWPDETEPRDQEHSWGFREFERLSLAARAAMALDEPGASEEAIQAAAKRANLDLDGFPTVYAEDILSQLARVADELGPDQGQRGKLKSPEQLAMRGGLQIIGCRIRSRRLKDGVRLVNARLPISLRFIGCVFECPLLLAHCHLVSLDVSGSAMRALDATGLRASGSVYLRRTVIRTPVSFSAAHIAGAFNASDSVIAPMAPAALSVPANPDHGILNLSGATIDNEVQLERARLWGGLSLRGAVFGRSLYLQHALIMSPLGLLEKRLGDLLGMTRDRSGGELFPKSGKRFAEAVEITCGMAAFDTKFAAFLHSPDKPVGVLDAKRDIRQLTSRQEARGAADAARTDALKELEVQTGETDRWRNLTARALMKMGGQAVSSAVRADNLRVDGTLNARGMISGGQFRMKYGSIKGAVRFDGALLRAAGHIRATVETILAHKSYRGSLDLEKVETLDALQAVKQKLKARIFLLDQKEAALPRGRKARRAAIASELASAERRREEAEALYRKISARRSISENTLKQHLREAAQLLEQTLGTWRFTDLWAMLVGSALPPAGTDPAAAAGIGGKVDRKTYFDHRWKAVEPWAAVDLRDSQLVGDLSFGVETDVEADVTIWGFRNSSQPVDLYGSMLLESLSSGGSIIMNRLVAHAPEVMDELIRPLPRDKGVRTWRDKCSEFYFGREERRNFASAGVMRAIMKAPAQRTLQMSQVKAGRDIDLRRSTGLAGIDLENAIVGGDLKFSSGARLAEDQDLDSPSRFFLCEGRAKGVQGLVRLRSAKVGGDVRLLFDPRKGPTIDASMLSVDGQLEIYPQIGTKSYQLEALLKQRDADTGFWLAACDHRAETSRPGPHRGLSPGRVCKHCNVVLDAVESRWTWSVDLSRARATVFAHAPAAWPDPGALTLDGFAYQQVAEVGPLHPRQLSTTKNNYVQRRRRRFVWREHKLDSVAWWTAGVGSSMLLMALFAGALWRFANHEIRIGAVADVLESLRVLPLLLFPLGVALAINVYMPPGRQRRGVGRLIAQLLLAGILGFGIAFALEWAAAWLRPHDGILLRPIPTISFVGSFVALLFLAMTTSRFLGPGWGLSAHFPFVHNKKLTPRAIEYLSRQRVLENRFQWRSAGHPVLETYVRAAKVLREGGRFISANTVEEQRLRLRTEMLSWRHHGAAKLALIAVDAFSGYGFRLWRATLAIVVIILGVAWIGHLAAVDGFLVRQRPLEASTMAAGEKPRARAGTAAQAALSPETNAAGSGKVDPKMLYRPGCSPDGGVGVVHQDCPDFIFAADLLLPFIDLKEADRWQTTIPAHRQWWFRDRWSEPWSSLLTSLALQWPAFVRVLGLFLTGIVGAAIASRIEAALAKIEE